MKRCFWLSLLFFCLWVPAISFGSPHETLGLPHQVPSQWRIEEQSSPHNPGYYYLKNRSQEKFDGYIGSVPLFPDRSPQEDIQSRVDRFLAGQPNSFAGIRYQLNYGEVPAEQIVYQLYDPNDGKILAWFTITYWAYNGNLYSLHLCALNDPALAETDLFLTHQFGEKKILSETILPH